MSPLRTISSFALVIVSLTVLSPSLLLAITKLPPNTNRNSSPLALISNLIKPPSPSSVRKVLSSSPLLLINSSSSLARPCSMLPLVNSPSLPLPISNWTPALSCTFSPCLTAPLTPSAETSHSLHTAVGALSLLFLSRANPSLVLLATPSLSTPRTLLPSSVTPVSPSLPHSTMSY